MNFHGDAKSSSTKSCQLYVSSLLPEGARVLKKIGLKMNILARNVRKYCFLFSGVAEPFWLGRLKTCSLRQYFSTQNFRLNH